MRFVQLGLVSQVLIYPRDGKGSVLLIHAWVEDEEVLSANRELLDNSIAVFLVLDGVVLAASLCTIASGVGRNGNSG